MAPEDLKKGFIELGFGKITHVFNILRIDTSFLKELSISGRIFIGVFQDPDGPLFFASSSYLEDKITERMRSKSNLKHIILVSNGINDIDASGEETLSLLIDRVRSAGIDISLSGINETVMGVLKRTHLREKIGEDHIFPTMEKYDLRRSSHEDVFV